MDSPDSNWRLCLNVLSLLAIIVFAVTGINLYKRSLVMVGLVILIAVILFIVLAGGMR